MKAGLVSVSFRKLTVREVCQAAKDAGLSYIEWGSDVHMPVGDPERLEEVLQLQKEFNITCCSYGTYFRLGVTPTQELPHYIRVAKALGTNILRLWCGEKSPAAITPEEKEKLFADSVAAAKIAKDENVILCLECHANTYTETKEGALEIMEYVNSPHFQMYWQPNSIHTVEENIRYAELLKPYIHHLHVYYSANGKQQPLAYGINQWHKYLKAFSDDHYMLLEFMPDNQVTSLPSQAKALRDIIAGKKNRSILLCNNGKGNLIKVYNQETLKRLQEVAGLDEQMYSLPEVLENPEAFHDVRYVFSTWGMAIMTEEQIRTCFPNLECVFYGAGTVQHFARPFLNCGVKVFSAWMANAVPVAEFCLAEILLANKGFYTSSRLMSNGNYEASKEARAKYLGNYDTKVGIIGTGAIGALVCEMLKPFRVKVLAYSRSLTEEKAAKMGVIKSDIDTIFSTCHVVSNHMADNDRTKGIFTEKHFAAMLPYATFINTGRGAQVVEADLAKVLAERPDLTAVLDVTFPEPPEADSPFYQLPNCVLTPHTAGSNGNEVYRMSEYMADECCRYIKGENTLYEVTEDMLERMA